MKLLFPLLLIVTLNTSFNYGSGPAYLTCKSESGRTLFKATIDDIDGTFQEAELSVDGVKLKFSDTDQAYCIFDSANGVYTLFIESGSGKDFANYKYLKFWSIPQTFKALLSTREHEKYQFKAKLYAKDPRNNKGPQTPTIELRCVLEYQI